MAQATTTMRLGTCVTNPATREPTVTASALAVLDELSGGRMDLGIGRGDSARRVLGKPPTSMKDLEQAVHVIRALVEGRGIEFEGTMLELPWTTRAPAAGVDRGLRAGGAQADRPDRGRGDAPDRRSGPHPLVRLAGARLRRGGRARPEPRPGHGRGAGARRATSRTGATGRAGSRRSSGNHVVDLVNKYPREDLPEELTAYVRDREGYDYLHHAEVGSSNASFVTDEIVDRFCLVGEPEQHIARLRTLAEAGVDQFNLYLMNGNEEEQVELYGKHIIPALRDVAPARA